MDAEKHGVKEFSTLKRMIKQKEFDVIIIRHADRLGRKASMCSEVISRITREANAKIYVTSMKRMIDKGDDAMFAAFESFQTTAEQDRRTQRAKIGLDHLIVQGIPVSVPITHLRVRDDRGVTIGLKLNEAVMPAMQRMAELLLKGYGYDKIYLIMKREGYTNPGSGKPYAKSFIARTFHNPITWGYAARYHSFSKLEAWVYNPDIPPPPGVLINRDTGIPPLFTGETAVLIKSELDRRRMIYGGRRPDRVQPFSGLLVCWYCGRSLVSGYARHKYRYYRCPGIYTRYLGGERIQEERKCKSSGVVASTTIQMQINDYLEYALTKGTLPIISNETEKEIESLEHQLVALQKRLNVLIMQQAEALEMTRGPYAMAIERVGMEIDGLNKRIYELKKKQETRQEIDERTQSIEQIRALALENFWKQSHIEIHQSLLRLIGKHRFVVKDGEIVDLR